MHNYFKNIGLHINEIIHLSPKEAYQACIEGALIVDVRKDFEILY